MAPCAADEELQFVHDGSERTYRVHVPASYAHEAPAPLIVALHGRSGNSGRMVELTGFNTRADDHGFIVAYPDALDGAWNYVHGIPGYRDGPNDSEFLLEVVRRLAARYRVDTRRIYAVGISNGGFMAQRLACYAPGRFAAFASVAAGGYAAMPMQCKEYSPVNVLYIHGTEDRHVPWQGLGVEDPEGNRQLVTMSITRTLEFWSGRNGCGPDVSGRELARKGDSPGTSVQFLSASECPAGAEVGVYVVFGGGHNWPGSRGVIPAAVAGRVNMDIHASDVVWSFFRRHALPDGSGD